MGDAVEGQWWWFHSTVYHMPHRPCPRWVAKGENSGGGGGTLCLLSSLLLPDVME